MIKDSIVPLATPEEIHSFARNLWATDIFRQSHDEGGFVHEIVDRMASLPVFFFRASDEKLEKAHFATWWRGIQLRDYDNPAIHDLYYLHEFFHAGDMIYADNLSFDAFRRKMQDNELDASTCSEIEAYFRLPDLRDNSFRHPIFADRFLNNHDIQKRWETDPERMLKELRMHRQNVMMTPLPANHSDRTEFWIRQFNFQNESWANIWVHRYNEVEKAMVQMRETMASFGPRAALEDHIEWLQSSHVSFGGDVPFPDEARAFSAVYWATKAAYDRDYAANPPSPTAGMAMTQM